MILSLRCPPTVASRSLELTPISRRSDGFVECALKGPRPRYPRVWKSRKRIGTISKSQKLLQCIKGLSNVKEEVYGALDSFIAWELEFPLIVVKKALKTLENEKEWKRIIQMTKWMLSKGQGKTMGTYYTLLNALAEDGRLEEAEELWMKLFSEYLENLPREFYSKMISIYYSRGMHDKLFEVFADMEELGVRPNNFIVEMLGNVFQELGMMDKYEKLKKKYPPAKWEYRYFKGKRVRVRSKQPNGTPVEGNGTNLSNQASEVDEQAYSSLNQNEVGEEAYDNSLSTLSELDDGDHKLNSLNQLGEIDEEDYQTNSLNQPTDVDEEDYRTNSLNQLNEVDEEANVHSIN